MDTTETYIKMSDDDEVQALADLLSLEAKQGSVFVQADNHNVVIWAANMITAPPAIKFIRLFRQDQLQEMLGLGSVRQLLLDFDQWLHTHVNQLDKWLHEDEYSMEQLWLAYVMREYNKVWNGEEWVKVT